jgi:cholera toxin transcriptional activator
MTKQKNNLWTFNPTLRRQLTKKNGEISKKLHSTDCKILEILCQHEGSTVSKSTLIKAAWPGRVVSKASLTQSIAHLRMALGDNGREQNIIKTVPKHGYCLVKDVIEMKMPVVSVQDNRLIPPPNSPQEPLKVEVQEKKLSPQRSNYIQKFILLVLSLILLLSIAWLTQIIYYDNTTERIEWERRDYLGVTYFFNSNENGENHFKAFKGAYKNNLFMLYISENPEEIYLSCVYQLKDLHVRNTLNMSFSRNYSIEKMKAVINEQCQ